MATSTTPKRKRRDPTSTPPRSPANIDTAFAPSGVAPSPTFPSPKSPHSVVANRLSNLSIQGATIPETPEQSPVRRTRLSDEPSFFDRQHKINEVYRYDNQDAVLSREVEYLEYATDADAMDITPPQEPQYPYQPPLADQQTSSISTSAEPNNQPSFSSQDHSFRTALRHPHHHHRKRSSHSLRTSPPHRPLSPISKNKHPHVQVASTIRRPHSPLPSAINIDRPRSPAPPSFSTPLDSTSTPADLADPPTLEMLDPEDDGYGINGIGYKPTPQMAYARAQKRKQQVMEWRAREAREARQRRIERRGVAVARDVRGVQMEEMDGRRIVRFA